MAKSLDDLISDAETRAQDNSDAARAYLNASVQELMGLFNNPGLAGSSSVRDPAPPKGFVPAIPPQLTDIGIDTGGAPGGPPTPDTLPGVTDGVGPTPTFQATLPGIVLPPRPAQLAPFTEAAPQIDTELTLDAPPSMDVGTAPVAPVAVMPTKPGGLRQFSRVAPTIRSEFDFPAPPDLLTTIKPAPAIGEYDVPVKPSLDFPSFTATAPGAPADAPANLDTALIDTYRQTAPVFIASLEGQIDAYMAKVNPDFRNQMGRLEEKLRGYIVDQGTALRPEIENAIFERSKSKVNAEFRRACDTAFSDAAKRGLTLPDGAAYSAVRQARIAGADANARAAVEIAVKQAELEQQNIQFAINISNQLRTAVLQSSISYHQSLVALNGQSVEMAKSVVNSIIEMFNAAVRVYSAKLDAYKAEASVYETHIRAIATQVDVYRAEISALQALTQVDATRVEAYKSGIEALQAISGVYRSQIDAVVAQANLEKLKLDAFGAEVEAYRAETQAKTAEWQGYAAAVGGEEAKARLYAAQMDGYRAAVDAKRAQMDGYKTSAEVQIARLNAERIKIDGYLAKVQAFAAKANANKSEWDGYSAAIGGEVAKIQGFAAQAGAFASQVAGWKAQIDANATKITATATTNKARLEGYSAETVAYGERMRAEGARAAAAIQFQQQLINAYDAANRAAVAAAEADSRYYQSQVQVAIERGRLDSQVLIENSKVRLAAADGISRSIVSGGQVFAGMANAALAGMNTLVSKVE